MGWSLAQAMAEVVAVEALNLMLPCSLDIHMLRLPHGVKAADLKPELRLPTKFA